MIWKKDCIICYINLYSIWSHIDLSSKFDINVGTYRMENDLIYYENL